MNLFVFVHPQPRGECAVSESCCVKDAGAGEGWGVGEAVAVWDQGTFLVLEPAFQAGKHVGGGGLMAMMLNFLLSLVHWKHLW